MINVSNWNINFLPCILSWTHVSRASFSGLSCSPHKRTQRTQCRSTSSACDNNMSSDFEEEEERRESRFFRCCIFAWPVVKRCISIVNSTQCSPPCHSCRIAFVCDADNFRCASKCRARRTHRTTASISLCRRLFRRKSINTSHDWMSSSMISAKMSVDDDE